MLNIIKPDKHTNLELSVLNVSGQIIKVLLKSNKNLMGFDELLEVLISKINLNVKDVYLLSLSFLFLLGKIEYYQDKDIVKLII